MHAQTSGNTVAVYGTAQEKDLQEIPNVISQLGADSLLSMQKMVRPRSLRPTPTPVQMQSLQSSGAGMGAFGGRPPFGGMPPSAGGAPDPEDDVPDLVDGDEPPASGNKLEEVRDAGAVSCADRSARVIVGRPSLLSVRDFAPVHCSRQRAF